MALAASAGLARATEPYDAPQTGLPDAVQSHIDLAYLILKGDVSRRNLPGTLYVVNDKVFEAPVPAAKKRPTAAAARAFDQFYYLGINWVSAWALNTPGGIILFDTLDSSENAQTYIEGGLRRVGLDPKNIKYIVLTHGHPDHYGGAKYLQDKYHAKVLMSAIDWDGIKTAPGATPPARDVDVVDGQKLSLGGVTLTFYLTPGHTPGTISTLIPVTDHGKPHMISFIGGTGLTTPEARAGAATLRNSLERFAKLSLAAGADVLVTSHPFLDDAWDKAELVDTGKAGAVSPWVATPDAVLRYYAATIEAVSAIEAYDRLKAADR